MWLGLQRSLIVIDTPTLVLGRRASPRRALSPLVVLTGSANSTSRQPVLPPSNSSLLTHHRTPRLSMRDCARFLHTKHPCALRLKRGPPRAQHCTTSRLGTFNRSNNLVGSLPWYYRACWHQNLAQIAFTCLLPHALPRDRSHEGPLTISAPRHWIVFVPAASLGHESCLSGFLCGIGP